jgi:hypothetical protein
MRACEASTLNRSLVSIRVREGARSATTPNYTISESD